MQREPPNKYLSAEHIPAQKEKDTSKGPSPLFGDMRQIMFQAIEPRNHCYYRAHIALFMELLKLKQVEKMAGKLHPTLFRRGENSSHLFSELK